MAIKDMILLSVKHNTKIIRAVREHRRNFMFQTGHSKCHWCGNSASCSKKMLYWESEKQIPSALIQKLFVCYFLSVQKLGVCVWTETDIIALSVAAQHEHSFKKKAIEHAFDICIHSDFVDKSVFRAAMYPWEWKHHKYSLFKKKCRCHFCDFVYVLL